MPARMRNPYRKRRYPYAKKRTSRYISKSAPRAVYRPYGSPFELKQKVVSFQLKPSNADPFPGKSAGTGHTGLKADETASRSINHGDPNNTKFATGSGYRYLVQPLLAISQGSAFNERIGNKIQLKSIDVKCTIESKLATHGPIACYLIMDKSPNGSSPMLKDIFHTGDGRTYEQRNVQNSSRFKFLKTWYLGGTQSNDVGVKIIASRIKTHYEVKFQSGAVNDNACIVTNNLLLLCTHDTGLDEYEFNGEIEVRYIDA